MKQIKRKEAVYNDDFTECLEIGWCDYNYIEPFKETCSKVPDKLPENIINLTEIFNGNINEVITGYENWDTKNIFDMSDMFNGCENLNTLDLSKWNTENVVSTHNMFGNCTSLTTLDLSNFNIDNLLYLSYMFNGCENIITIDMFKINHQLETGNLFRRCNKLKTVNFK